MDPPPPNGGPPPPPPPPPPPHGANPKSSSGLPNGNYDIFIIPPHSAGGGFLYLPSLRPHPTSFAAGVLSTLLLLAAWHLVQPIVKAWVQAVSQSGSGFGMLVLVLVVGFGGWIYGRAELPKPDGQGSPKRNGGPPPQNGYANGSAHGAGPHPKPQSGPQWGAGPNPPPGAGPGFGAHGPQGPGYGPRTHSEYGQEHYYQPPPKPSHTPPPPFEDTPPNATREPTPEPAKEEPKPKPKPPPSTSSSAAWEKAREETRRREEERKRQDEIRRKEEEERRKKEQAERDARAAAEKLRWEQLRAREKEARERELREKQARDRIAKEKEEQAAKEAKEDEERKARLKAAQERAEKLRAERAASEKAASERAKSEKAVPTYGVGERTNPYSVENMPPPPKSTIGVEPTKSAAGFGTPRSTTGSAAPPKPESPPKPYQQPSARTYAGTATDTAFRPYDKPKPKEASSQSSYVSGSSYSPSESTAPTSAAPSYGGPYTTNDPEKVLIHGAFKFNDSFPNGPTASVRPGDGSITNGLIMRMNTEGVFLDDDRRGEALRQWDIKAWTLTGIETINKANFYLVRASVRSVDNLKHVYVVPVAEQWKVAAGLKRLKGGSLLRSSCSMSVMNSSEANKLLSMVGAV